MILLEVNIIQTNSYIGLEKTTEIKTIITFVGYHKEIYCQGKSTGDVGSKSNEKKEGENL